MKNNKLLNDTKNKFLTAYKKSGENLKNFNDMLYYMNILALLKYYPQETTAKQLAEMIYGGQY